MSHKIFLLILFIKVEVWKNKVDRSCVERIRAFQNPPALIGQIMEMIIILVGKQKLPESSFLFKTDQQQSTGKEEKNTNENLKANKQRKIEKIFIIIYLL